MKKYKIHPLFILYLIFLIFMGQFNSLIIYFFVVLIHEFAHNYTAKKLGYKLDKFTLMPYGVCLNYKTNIFALNDEIKIAIMGPLVNAVLSIFCLALWWLFPLIIPFTYVFCVSNMVLFIFNLLPCYPLDGGRVLTAFLTKKYNRKTAVKITLFFNILLCVIFVLTFFIGLFFKVINTNLLIISLFLFSSILEPNNSTSYNYIVNKNNSSNNYLKADKQIKFTLIYSNEKLYKILAKISKYKFNVFYVIFPSGKIKILTEIAINNFAIKYSPTFSLDEVPEMFL